MTAEQFLRDHDVQYYLEDTPVFMARMHMANADVPVMGREHFSALVEDTCRYWQRKRKPMSKAKSLNNAGWSRLQKVIAEMKDDLRGKTRDEAVMLVRTQISCNGTLLDNVSIRLRVWDSAREAVR